MSGHDADSYRGVEGLATLPRVMQPALVHCEALHREPPQERPKPNTLPNTFHRMLVMEAPKPVERKRPSERPNAEFRTSVMEPSRPARPRRKAMSDFP